MISVSVLYQIFTVFYIVSFLFVRFWP